MKFSCGWIVDSIFALFIVQFNIKIKISSIGMEIAYQIGNTPCCKPVCSATSCQHSGGRGGAGGGAELASSVQQKIGSLCTDLTLNIIMATVT